ncbi:MAG: hypothetical protein IT323_17540 [Anaerolineae bacterium]|nr:hypothetical protein [Anaerolineae bacterium]
MTDDMRDEPMEPKGKPDEGASGEAKSAFEEFAHHQRLALEAAGKAVSALFPPEFKSHGSKALDEFKKSFQVLADRLKEMMEKAGEAAKDPGDEPPTTTGKTKVRVELN